MQITVISSLPPLKGISKYTVALIDELAKLVDVEVVGFKCMYPKRLYPDTATMDTTIKCPDLDNLHIRSFLTWYNPLTWIWAGLSVRGHIVHAQWWSHVLAPVYITTLILAKYIRRKPIVITVHNVRPHETGRAQSLADRMVYTLANHYIVHTENNKQVLIDYYSIQKSNISVVPHGILFPNNMRGVLQPEAKKQLEIPAQKPVLLNFGIIRDYKGVDVLLQAFAQVIQQIPEATLVIAGKPWVEWERYQTIIDRYKLRKNIRLYLEYIPENQVEKFFSAADIIVLPYTHFDSQSGVGSQVLSFEKPLVVTNTGGLCDLVKRHEALAEPENPDDLAKKLSIILKSDELLSQLKEDSIYLAKNLSWDVIALQTVNIYQQLIDTQKKRENNMLK